MQYHTSLTNLKQRRFNPLFALVVLVLMAASACEVLDDPATSTQQDAGPDTDVPAEDAVDLGSGNVTLEAAAFATLLHNDSEKAWAAQQFTLEGFSLFQECRLDDVMTLFSDGTYAFDGGALLCGAEDDTRNRTGAYNFDVEAATITFDEGTPQEATATIITLENNAVVLEGQYVSDVFGTFNVTGRYTN